MVKKLLSVLAIVVALMVSAMAAPVGAAQLKGTYAFQVLGVSNSYGYYNSKNVWVNLNNGNDCPKNVGCFNQSFGKLAVGVISFNGAGVAKFVSFKQYDPSNQSGGGPTVNVAYKYTVSGTIGNLTISGPKGGIVGLTLGAPNAAGIMQVVQLFVNDTNPSSGTAILQ